MIKPYDARWLLAVDLLLREPAGDQRMGLIWRPSPGCHALLGEKLQWGETLEQAITRGLREELGLTRVTASEGIVNWQIAGVVGLFSPRRDPRFCNPSAPVPPEHRAQVLSVVVLVNISRYRLLRSIRPTAEAPRLDWFTEQALPPASSMFLDHRAIIDAVLQAEREKRLPIFL